MLISTQISGYYQIYIFPWIYWKDLLAVYIRFCSHLYAIRIWNLQKYLLCLFVGLLICFLKTRGHYLGDKMYMQRKYISHKWIRFEAANVTRRTCSCISLSSVSFQGTGPKGTEGHVIFLGIPGLPSIGERCYKIAFIPLNSALRWNTFYWLGIVFMGSSASTK